MFNFFFTFITFFDIIEFINRTTFYYRMITSFYNFFFIFFYFLFPSFIKLIEKDKTKDHENNIQTNRRTYNSNRPISNFNYDEYNRKNVYERLYEQKIKFIKRKEK